jgi:hypothetical protein
MRSKILTLLFLSLVFTLGGCVKDDLDELQSQIDELNQKVVDLEKSQQEALLQAIADLQASLAALESSNSEQYATLLANLEIIEEEVANNASAVYYGNLLTEAEYDAFIAQGATIVTGKVTARTADHITALADVKLIGGDFNLNATGDISLSNLQNVGQNIVVTGLMSDATVTLGGLSSIGGELNIVDNPKLLSFTADELVLINNSLIVESDTAMTALSLAKLDMVGGDLYINNRWEENPNYTYTGHLVSVDLSYTDVAGGVEVMFLGGTPNAPGADLTFGNIGGGFACMETGINSVEITGDAINGDFELSTNRLLSLATFENITRIEGTLTIKFNSEAGWTYSQGEAGLTEFPAFSALTYLGGNVDIAANDQLVTFEAFNNVVEMAPSFSSSINIEEVTGSKLEVVRVFEKFASAGPNSWDKISNISINVKTNWFDGFNTLDKAGTINLSVGLPSADGGIGIRTTAVTTDVRIDGFDAMAQANTLFISATDATMYNAFPVFMGGQYGAANLTIYMPTDAAVDMCSMNTYLTGLTDLSQASFWEYLDQGGWGYNQEVADKAAAISDLTASCQ